MTKVIFCAYVFLYVYWFLCNRLQLIWLNRFRLIRCHSIRLLPKNVIVYIKLSQNTYSLRKKKKSKNIVKKLKSNLDIFFYLRIVFSMFSTLLELVGYFCFLYKLFAFELIFNIYWPTAPFQKARAPSSAYILRVASMTPLYVVCPDLATTCKQ